MLSDASRNDVMLEVVTKHSPGRRVLEIGCGTGFLTCVAARCGATRVVAVEPTDMIDVAREVIQLNGLQDKVTVLPGLIEDAEPQPVDFVFSELLHSDPFSEGVVSASNAVNKWLVKGGVRAPYRLRVMAALAEAPGPAWEMQNAEREMRLHGERFDLDLSPITEVFRTGKGHLYSTNDERPVGPPVEVFNIKLGDGRAAPAPVERVLRPTYAGPVAGVMVWFEADMDDQIVLANPPMRGGHWGQLVWAFGREFFAKAGEAYHVRFEVKGQKLHVELLPKP